MQSLVFAARSAAFFCALLLAPLTAAQTQMFDYCFQSTDPQNYQCRAYIAGFLDGSVITDAAIVDSLIPADLSPAALGYISPPPTFYADFCLPEDLTIDEASLQIFTQLSVNHDVNQDMSSAVYEIVKDEFPCER